MDRDSENAKFFLCQSLAIESCAEECMRYVKAQEREFPRLHSLDKFSWYMYVSISGLQTKMLVRIEGTDGNALVS